MSPSEIATRVLRIGSRRAVMTAAMSMPFSDIAADSTLWLPVPSAETRDIVISAADAMLSGDYRFLGVSDPLVTRWLRDPLTGIEVATARRVDVSDPAQVGSIKTLWEKNRHLHLCAIAAAYRFTQDEAYAHEVLSQLMSWLDQNPVGVGVNWSSGIEVALRMHSWLWVERLLRGSTAWDALFGDQGVMWPSVWYGRTILGRLPSIGSSANNHAIAELFGVVVCDAGWSRWSESRADGPSAWDKLQLEVLRQTDDTGFTREQAVGYHRFVTEMGLAALLEASRARWPVRPEFIGRLASMVGALAYFVDNGGHVADFGDDDGSRVLGFAAGANGAHGFVRALGAVILGLDRPAFCTAADVDLAEMFASGVSHPVELESDLRLCGDIVKLESPGDPSSAEVWFDAAPLGLLPLAAHGHADALSMLVSISGIPLLIDAGTFQFGYDKAARCYFRSTAAHNTVSLDGLDQSVQAGDFLWRSHAVSELVELEMSEDHACVHAVHDGYTRLRGVGVVHRSVLLKQGALFVSDAVEGRGRHHLQLRFHIAPEWQVAVLNGRVRFDLDDRCVELALDPSLDWTTLVADDSGGWVSRAFNTRVPCTTLVGSGVVTLPWSAESRFSW